MTHVDTPVRNANPPSFVLQQQLHSSRRTCSCSPSLAQSDIFSQICRFCHFFSCLPSNPTVAMLSVAVLAMLAMFSTAVARETSSFDQNWLFQLGDAGYAPQLSCNHSSFMQNLTTERCAGASMIFVSSAALCEAACCGNPACTFWQWCEQPCLPASPGWGCQNGYDACPVKQPTTNWTGAQGRKTEGESLPPSKTTSFALQLADAVRNVNMLLPLARR